MNSFVTKVLPKKLQYQTIKCTTMTHLHSFDLKTFLTPTNVYVENMKYTSENDLNTVLVFSKNDFEQTHLF